MNSVVEKLAAIEKEVAAIQPKMAPLTERIADLDQKVAGFAQQLSGIAEESAAVKQDIELTRKSLARIQTLIGESKVESEQLAAGQEENLQRCETMTAVFGAAFQAVSQFFETAQRMGLADQAKAVFLNSSSPPAVSVPPPIPNSVADTAPVEVPTLESPTVSQPVDEMPLIDELPPASEPIPAETVSVESVTEEEPPALETPTAEPPTMESPEETESALSEADFDSVMPDTEESEPPPWSAPSLPDVAAPPEIAGADMDSEGEADMELSNAMASQLDVPPLNLATPAPPEQSESAAIDETEEEEIEAMLATMMTPVTATAGT